MQLLRRERRNLGTVFEFCAGPGFIAFALLADGLAHAAVLADVNPIAVECARKTVRENQLSDRVRVHLANGTRGLPASENAAYKTREQFAFAQTTASLQRNQSRSAATNFSRNHRSATATKLQRALAPQQPCTPSRRRRSACFGKRET